MDKTDLLPRGQYFGMPSLGKQMNGCTFLNRVYPAESSLPWHSHEAPFFCLLVSGTYKETYGSRDWIYEAGSVVFHPAGESHKTSMGMHGGKVFLIEIGDQWFGDMYHLPSQWETRCENARTPVSWLTLQIQKEFSMSEQASLMMEGLVLELLARTNQMEKIRFAPLWLNRVMEFIRDNWQAPFTIKQLANTIGIHPFHLARVFQHFNGASIGEFVNRMRIDEAVKIVRKNDSVNLSDLALQLGFADQSHFTRMFKRFTQTTPAAMLRSGKNGDKNFAFFRSVKFAEKDVLPASKSK